MVFQNDAKSFGHQYSCFPAKFLCPKKVAEFFPIFSRHEWVNTVFCKLSCSKNFISHTLVLQNVETLTPSLFKYFPKIILLLSCIVLPPSQKKSTTYFKGATPPRRMNRATIPSICVKPIGQEVCMKLSF